jgi:carbon storage regulator
LSIARTRERWFIAWGNCDVPAGEAPAVLVLTRKSNQSIMIGDEIEVSVLAIMGEKVRIGIEAPRAVPVFRREVYVEIREGSGTSGAGTNNSR